MPHQCVRCNTFYEDGARELLKGCSCGGRLFFFIKQEKLEEMRKITEDVKLSQKDREQIEQDIFDLVGSEIDRDQPVILDLEAIRIVRPGKYELDLVHLFKGEPLIFKLEDGKYMIEQTGIDGLGLARGLYGKPWLFKQIKDYLKTGRYQEMSLADIKKTAIKHAVLAEKMKGKRGLFETRKHLAWYVKGFPGAGELRAKLVRAENAREVKEIFSLADKAN